MRSAAALLMLLPVHSNAVKLAEVSALRPVAVAYTSALAAAPILTKSATAGVVFGLSDLVAQRIEGSEYDWCRVAACASVGLCFFGPAAHWWLEALTARWPSSGLRATLIKTLLGQVIFGPAITCVFFASSCVAAGGLAGLSALPAKIRADFWGVQVAGVGFWPFVDLVSFRFLRTAYIPLFANACSFVWTVYLSLQAARGLR